MMSDQNPFVGDCPRQTLENLAGGAAVVQACACAVSREEHTSSLHWGLWLLAGSMEQAALSAIEGIDQARPANDD